jgi:CheY-like chemotaxis protein
MKAGASRRTEQVLGERRDQRVRDSKDTLVGYAKVTRDLTVRKRAEESTARITAERANRARTSFSRCSATSCEIRSRRSRRRSADEAARPDIEGADVIERQLGHMMRLVTISWTCLGSCKEGRAQARSRRSARAIAKAIEIASTLVEQKQHHLDVDIEKAELLVNGDEARLVQVFANLLVNAAKYTEPGGHITIAVRTTDDELVVDVRRRMWDGRAPPARVFDLFVQGNQGVERSRGGLGIGLTLVRQLVEQHRGTVEAHSPGLGKGSTFSVRLPRAGAGSATKQPALEKPVCETADRRRVLVVDDNEDAMMILGELLSASGHDVRTAGDPATALAVARSFRPEVAILDIGLPVMDGYELATRLRAQPGGKEMKLIALTGYGQQSDRASGECRLRRALRQAGQPAGAHRGDRAPLTAQRGDLLVHESGGAGPSGAHVLLEGRLDEPADREHVRLDEELAGSFAAVIAVRLAADDRLAAQLALQHVRRRRRFPDLRLLVEDAGLDVAEAVAEQLRPARADRASA